jgi:hypothetical protein
VSESTGSILVVVVTLVASTITALTLINSMILFQFFIIMYLLSHSHPGYFGKVGMRHYHLTKNKYFCPTINVDKLWSLIGDAARERFAARKDGAAPIIDVTKAVRTHQQISLSFTIFLTSFSPISYTYL